MTGNNGKPAAKTEQPLLFTNEELNKCYGLRLLEFENPKNDGELLHNLQADYIRDRSEEKYLKLWLLVEKTAKNIIYKIEEKKKITLQPETVEDAKTEATLYLMRRYKKNLDYYIKNNFIAAIWDAVIHALYYGNAPKLEANSCSLDEIDEDIINTEGGFKKL